MKAKEKREIITFDAGNGLRQHLDTEAKKRGLGISRYVKLLAKKYSKFKEPKQPDLV